MATNKCAQLVWLQCYCSQQTSQLDPAARDAQHARIARIYCACLLLGKQQAPDTLALMLYVWKLKRSQEQHRCTNCKRRLSWAALVCHTFVRDVSTQPDVRSAVHERMHFFILPVHCFASTLSCWRFQIELNHLTWNKAPRREGRMQMQFYIDFEAYASKSVGNSPSYPLSTFFFEIPKIGLKYHVANCQV